MRRILLMVIRNILFVLRFIGTNYVIMQDMLKSIQRKNTMNY